MSGRDVLFPAAGAIPPASALARKFLDVLLDAPEEPGHWSPARKALEALHDVVPSENVERGRDIGEVVWDLLTAVEDVDAPEVVQARMDAVRALRDRLEGVDESWRRRHVSAVDEMIVESAERGRRRRAAARAASVAARLALADATRRAPLVALEAVCAGQELVADGLALRSQLAEWLRRCDDHRRKAADPFSAMSDDLGNAASLEAGSRVAFDIVLEMQWTCADHTRCEFTDRSDPPAELERSLAAWQARLDEMRP